MICEKCGTEVVLLPGDKHRPELCRDALASRVAAAERSANVALKELAEQRGAVSALEAQFKTSEEFSSSLQSDCDAMGREIDALEAQLKTAREALAKIACFADVGAERHLDKTGSYAHFDEPSSVEQARTALASLALGTHSGSEP